MATTLKEKMGALTPERRARIDAETDRLHDEYKIFRAAKPFARTISCTFVMSDSQSAQCRLMTCSDQALASTLTRLSASA